jgi:phage gp37-like protein
VLDRWPGQQPLEHEHQRCGRHVAILCQHLARSRQRVRLQVERMFDGIEDRSSTGVHRPCIDRSRQPPIAHDGAKRGIG